MTVPGSSSWPPGQPDLAAVDVLAAGLIGGLPAALAGGAERELLAPLRVLTPGTLPVGRPPAVDRRELAEALGVANAAYGHPAAVDLARRLADPATRVVVGGQQPGLFGGPLYTLSKAVAIARLASRLEESGVPAVGVFWVATEDHDFAETSRAVLLGPAGPESFSLGEDPAPLLPLGMRTLGPRVAEVLAEMAQRMVGERFAAWLAQLARWYRPEARFGEAFSRLMVHLLGERCPLLLDAMLPAVKQAQRPLMRALVERRFELDDRLAARDRAIQERGFRPQVNPQRRASPLFLLHGAERRRIRWCDGDRFTLRGAGECEHRVEWLLAAIEENPGVVSPGVLARPAFQDALLGSSIQVLGPGELSYMPQVAPVYELLGVQAPMSALRPQVLVLESHQLDRMATLGIELEDLVAPDFDLDLALARLAGGDFVASRQRRLEALLEELRLPAIALDPSLEKPWEKTQGQILKTLEAFSGKVTAALARQNEVARRRAVDLRESCRPLGALQERVVSTAHFPGKHGERFVEALWNQMGWDSARLQVIRL